MNYSSHIIKQRRGFSLLLAVLVGSFIISVGLGIFNVALKDSILSASGKESQSALYAADSGIECAQYWDVKNQTTAGDIFTPVSDGTYSIGIVCGSNGSIAVTATKSLNPDTNEDESTSTFNYNLTSDGANGPCVVVNVGKYKHTVGSDVFIHAFYEGRGYNTCNVGDPRRVERGLFLKT